jgi:hypothetical protein
MYDLQYLFLQYLTNYNFESIKLTIWVLFLRIILKNKGETCSFEEPSHVKQQSLNHVCKIGLKSVNQSEKTIETVQKEVF